jgi:hypothetical protein
MIPELDAKPETSNLLVRFRVVAVQKKDGKTLVLHPETGLPVFEDVEYIEIRVPGQRDIVDRPVTADDKQRFAPQYQAWKSSGGKDSGEVGTPLSLMPGLPPSIAAELKHFGCETVEQFAGMADGALKNVGPYVQWRDKARAFIAAAKGQAPITKLADENEALRRRTEALEKQLQELVAAKSKPETKQKQA